MKIQDLNIAILWLENNEGDEAERLPCLRVAEFLKAEIRRREVRAIARKHNVSTKMASAALDRACK